MAGNGPPPTWIYPANANRNRAKKWCASYGTSTFLNYKRRAGGLSIADFVVVKLPKIEKWIFDILPQGA